MESIKILSVNPGIISPSVYSDSTSSPKYSKRGENDAAKGIDEKRKSLNPLTTFWHHLRCIIKHCFSGK